MILRVVEAALARIEAGIGEKRDKRARDRRSAGYGLTCTRHDGWCKTVREARCRAKHGWFPTYA
jgi:hypothetical protein